MINSRKIFRSSFFSLITKKTKNMNLTQIEEKKLIDYVNQALQEDKPTRFMIEIQPESMSTDVKISIISEDVYLQTFGKESVIDWDNYDF